MFLCTLGDLTLDVIVRLRSAIAPRGDTEAEIRLAPGGQAANVAAWASALGAHARYIGKRGADEAGMLASARLEGLGVEVPGPAGGRGGVICSLVDPEGERSMLSDRGSSASFLPDELDPAWLAGCDHLFVSGYALLASPLRETASAAVEIARASGARISVDLASWSAIEQHDPVSFRSAVEALAPDVVFANEDEERIFGGSLVGPVWVSKRGARGCSFDGDERAALPVARVVDSTGAGDALAAGFVLGGPELALEAAARCVQQLGAVPVGEGLGSSA